MIIDNFLDDIPMCQFAESRVTAVAGSKSEQPIGIISSTFNPTATVPLRDPETGELTGDSTTQAQLYQLLYSLYMQIALERDSTIGQNI